VLGLDPDPERGRFFAGSADHIIIGSGYGVQVCTVDRLFLG